LHYLSAKEHHLNMSQKKTVAILFGGKSVEHQISINSAKNIYQYIDKKAYNVLLVGISQDGKWCLKTDVDGDFDNSTELFLSMTPDNVGFIEKPSGKAHNSDVVFPVLHGTDGEDGSIQGLLTTMDIPFVGTGVLGSALSMNKLYGKRLMKASNIPTSDFLDFTDDEKDKIDFEAISKKLGLPFMTKAANLGSSVGIYKVNSKAEFEKAVKDVFKYDHTLLCEAYIKGRELECSVMGNEDPIASKPGEIVVSEAYDFYTYEAKYLDPDAVELVVPAKVSEELVKKIKELSIKSYRALHCEDFARVDLFLSEDGEIMINEINTIPGFTNFSMFPMMWKVEGISFESLITKVIELAVERYRKNKNLVTSYQP